jgi:hypothetical protein
MQYDVIVLATFPEGGPDMPQQRTLAERRPSARHQRLLLGVHNPGQLLDQGRWLGQLLLAEALPAWSGGAAAAGARPRPVAGGEPWVGQPLSQPRVQLAALAPNVAAYTQALLEGWAAGLQGGSGASLQVPWLPPLVPWGAQLGHAPGSGGNSAGGGLEPYRHLCIQASVASTGTCSFDELRNLPLPPRLLVNRGCHKLSAAQHITKTNHHRKEAPSLPSCFPSFVAKQGSIHPNRRDYASAFAAAAHPAVLTLLRQRDESLLLVGNLRRGARGPAVPAALQPFVRIAANLKYKVGSDARPVGDTEELVNMSFHGGRLLGAMPRCLSCCMTACLHHPPMPPTILASPIPAWALPVGLPPHNPTHPPPTSIRTIMQPWRAAAPSSPPSHALVGAAAPLPAAAVRLLSVPMLAGVPFVSSAFHNQILPLFPRRVPHPQVEQHGGRRYPRGHAAGGGGAVRRTGCDMPPLRLLLCLTVVLCALCYLCFARVNPLCQWA